MIGQRHCPLCRASALDGCRHLALAAEAKDFVGRCVEMCQGRRSWQALCESRRSELSRTGHWSPEAEDFTWLETAFRDKFLKDLRWYVGLDYEWRSGPRPEQGGFWVLLWSQEPQRLWWELRDALERLGGPAEAPSASATPPWLLPPPSLPPRARVEPERKPS
jgi:hypothetical protein